MLDKGYLKNMSKLQSRLQIDNSRPTFLEDEEWEVGSKFAKSKRPTDQQKYSSKTSNVFDLNQIKKQLGLIELRNTNSEQKSVKNNKEEEAFVPHPSSFKKRKQQQQNQASRFLIKKKETEPIKFEDKNANGASGFTQRITELVKMREQHQKIISSLVHKKSFNISTDEQSMVGSRKRNNELQNKYMRVLELYETNQRQKIQDRKIQQRPSFKKQALQQKIEEFTQQTPSKKRTVEEMYQDIQAKINKTPKKKQSPKVIKRFQTSSQPTIENEPQHISESRVEQSIQPSGQNSPSVYVAAQQIAYTAESIKQSRQSERQLMESSRLNESTFQIQQHVNLIASLSQFQLKNEQTARNHALPLQSQLHYSVLTFVQSSLKAKVSRNQLLLSSIPQIQLKYACMEQNYQGMQDILQAVKKIKGLNRDFSKIVEFLCQNEVWEGLFSISELENIQNQSESESYSMDILQYHGLCFETGSYTEVTLSNKPLQNQQKKLLIFKFINNNRTLICDISLVLLHRLINLNTNKTFPEMLNRLFGYQFKTFKIQKLNDFMECLDYIDRLREIHNKELKNEGGLIVEEKLNQSLREKYSLKQIQSQENCDQSIEPTQYLDDTEKHCDFFLYGFSKTTECFELVKPSFFSQKNQTQSPIRLYEFRQLMRHEKYMKRLSQTFSVLSIINKKELPVKSINLKHFENHFVVVSVNVAEEGLYFMSVEGKNEEGKENDQVNYRLCLISSSNKTILECLILSRNESYPVYLPQQQFEVYISAYQTSEDQVNPSDIMNFTFYIQSPHICARNDFLNVQNMENRQLEFELRLKEEYKNYTSMVVEQFIELSFLDQEISKFFIDIENHQQKTKETERKEIVNEANKDQMVKPKNDKDKWKDQFDFEFTSTVKSLHFQDNRNQASKQKNPSKLLESPQINFNTSNQKKLSTGQQKKSTSVTEPVTQLIDSIFTFEQMEIEEKPLCIKILRVHLKALDLFIDCVNTLNLKQISTSNDNDFEFKIKYNQQRVLCDLNHHKNTVLLRSNTINLVYLTKDSQIESVTKQNEFCQKMHTKQSFAGNKITHKIFRKEW